MRGGRGDRKILKAWGLDVRGDDSASGGSSESVMSRRRVHSGTCRLWVGVFRGRHGLPYGYLGRDLCQHIDVRSWYAYLQVTHEFMYWGEATTDVLRRLLNVIVRCHLSRVIMYKPRGVIMCKPLH